MRGTVYSEEWLADRLMKQRTRNPKTRVPSRSETETDHLESTPSKYKNKKTVIDGETFDSKKEAKRYQDLIIRQRAGEIRDLTRQVRLPLEIDGQKVCTYVCDFRYEERANGGWRRVYEDAKGMRTPVYILKKKLVRALLKVEILET